MKYFLRVSACVFLPVLYGIPPAAAQEQQPAAARQPPAQPTPPTTPSSEQRTGTIQAPPQLPKVPDVRQPGETGWWLGVMAWFPKQEPIFNKGRGAAFDPPSLIDLKGSPNYARGADLGIAMGLHNALRFSYFDTRASGQTRTPTEIHVWDQTYDANTLVATDYRLQHGRISFDYLTWPYPVESRRFRLKTLWQFQYTNIRTGFDAPELPLIDSDGNPLIDSSTGQPLTYATTNSRWFMSPEIGIGASYFGGRHFRLEANAAGWAWPRRNSVWDADASANFRYGKFEVRFGGQGFHFKTNTSSEFFMRGTIYSGFVGLRWYSD